MTEPVPAGASAEAVRHALRRMRRENYTVQQDAAGCRVRLSMAATESGRRNAAEHIVGWLAAAGFGLHAPDAVAALTNGEWVPVSVAGR